MWRTVGNSKGYLQAIRTSYTFRNVLNVARTFKLLWNHFRIILEAATEESSIWFDLYELNRARHISVVDYFSRYVKTLKKL